MNPLEMFLNHDRNRRHSWRSSLSSAVGGPSTSFSRLATRIIWPRRLKHMRYLAPGILIQAGRDQLFTICRNGNPLLKSMSLAELVPAMRTKVSIVATGPTALDYPWDHFRNGERFLIAVNGAPTMLEKLGITPNLLVVTDREFALTGQRHFEAAPKTPLAIEFLAAAALASTAPHLLLDRSIAIIERINMWYGLPFLDFQTLWRMNEASGMPFVFPDIPDHKCRIGWSHRPDMGIFPGRTVVFGALQIAIGLGATDVEIIGMDFSGVGRAYAEDSEKRPTQLQEHYQSFILPSFQTMRLALAKKNLTVTNRSPVCPLPMEIFADISQTTDESSYKSRNNGSNNSLR